MKRSLAQIQEDFFRELTRPSVKAEGKQPMSTRFAEGFAVYRNSYDWLFDDVLNGDFPVSAKVIGEVRMAGLLSDFQAREYSTSFTFSDLARVWRDFVATQNTLTTQEKHLVEFEYELIECLYREQHAPVVSRLDEATVIQLAPGLRVREYEFAVGEFYKLEAIDHSLVTARHAIAFWSTAGCASFWQLSQAEKSILETLLAGRPLEAALESLPVMQPNVRAPDDEANDTAEGDAEALIQRAFSNLGQLGLVTLQSSLLHP